MKVFITKHSLTTGVILELHVSQTKEYDSCGEVVYTPDGDDKKQYFYSRNEEWHFKKDDAIRKAKEMRTSQVDFLTHEIIRLAKLTFE